MDRKIVLLLLLSFLFALSADAHNFNFRTIRVDEGLSENSVYSILQDSTGYMWLGTKDGLNRYDGRQIKIFRKDKTKPYTIQNNFIRSLCQPNANTLWIGTDNGVYIMDLITEKTTQLNATTSTGEKITTAVNTLLKSDNNHLWIGTMSQGLFVYHLETGILTQVNNIEQGFHSSITVWTLLSDKSGNIWIGSREGLFIFEKKNNELKMLSLPNKEVGHNEIMSLMQDEFGFIWAGTWSGGLQLYNSQLKQYVRSFFIEHPQPFISHIRALFEYSMNEIFIGSDDGLYLFNQSDESIKRIDTPNLAGSLSDQNVYSILQDREKGIWIGTYFGGVNYLHPNHLSMESYSPTPLPHSLSGKAVSQFCEDENGQILIATEDGGLNSFDPKSRQFTQMNKDFDTSYHNLHALLIADNRFLVGTFSRGLDVFDRKSKQRINYQRIAGNPQSLNDNCIFSLYRTSSGIIYIGTPIGLQTFNPDSGTFHDIKELSGNFIYDILEDEQENLWVASYNNGAFRYDASSKKWICYANRTNSNMHEAKLISVFIDSKKQIWFTSQGNGIFKYDTINDWFENINSIGEHSIDVVYGMLEDPLHNYWISTNNGLISFNPTLQEGIKQYTKTDGLQSNEFNFKSTFKSSTGKFYFGGVNGFNSFYPERLSTNIFIPNISITDFNLLNRSTSIADSTLLYGINKRGIIELPYNHSSFRISFVSLSFLAADQNQYTYKLRPLQSKIICI